MTKTTLKIDGMMCGMCEAHVNDAIRACVPVKKLTTSHSKGTAVLVTEAPVDETALRAAVDRTGYEVLSVQSEPYEKRGLFHRR